MRNEFPPVLRTIVKSDEGLEFHQEIDPHTEDYPVGVTEDDLGAYTIPDTPGIGLLALLYGPKVAGLNPAYGTFPRPGSHTVAEIDGTDDEHPALTINYRGYTDADAQRTLGLPASRIPVSFSRIRGHGPPLPQRDKEKPIHDARIPLARKPLPGTRGKAAAKRIARASGSGAA